MQKETADPFSSVNFLSVLNPLESANGKKEDDKFFDPGDGL